MDSNFIDLTSVVETELTASIEVTRAAFERVLASVSEGTNARQLHAVEKVVLDEVMELGRLLIAVWLKAQMPKQVGAVVKNLRGVCQYVGLSTEPMRTRFGIIQQKRPTYQQEGGDDDESALVSPYDRKIGLAGGRMSLGVHLLVAYLVAKMAFDEALDTMKQFGGYAPAKRSALGIVDHLGPEAREFLNELPAPSDDGEYLVIQVDCGAAPMLTAAEHKKRCRPHQKRPTGTSKRGVRRRKRQETPRPRRKKGDKSKNGRSAALAVVYTLRRLPDGTVEGPLNKRVLGTFRGLHHLFGLLNREVLQRGYGWKRTVFLSDGDKTIAALRRGFFPKATACLDWYHLCEYLWKAGAIVYKEGSDELSRWVHERKEELRSGCIDAVFEAFRKLEDSIDKSSPKAENLRERLAKIVNYVDKRRNDMPYAELLKLDLDIATGAVEGAVKHVVRARIDGQGMRWSPERAEFILALRLVVINGEWSTFEGATAIRFENQQSWTIPKIAPVGPRNVDISVLRKAA